MPPIGVLHLGDDLHLHCCLCLHVSVQLAALQGTCSCQLIPANRQGTIRLPLLRRCMLRFQRVGGLSAQACLAIAVGIDDMFKGMPDSNAAIL